MVLGHDVTHENTMTQSHVATPLCDAFSQWDCADQLSWYDPMEKTRLAMGKYMVLHHGDLMGNTIAEHHQYGGVYCRGVFPWCRISTSKAMGSKYHGKNSWRFMGFMVAEFLPQKPWGFFMVPMGNFYKGSSAAKILRNRYNTAVSWAKCSSVESSLLSGKPSESKACKRFSYISDSFWFSTFC
jgi:hypothetical protein